jgi:hypothetical protein
MMERPVVYGPQALVAVKSAWYSKINWIQVGGALLTTTIALVSNRVLGLDDATTVKVLGALNLIQGVATVIVKTWYTPTVTPGSI